MVRMQADARLPPAERLGYKHVGDALLRIGREEGLTTYWRGATPTGEAFFYADSCLRSPCLRSPLPEHLRPASGDWLLFGVHGQACLTWRFPTIPLLLPVACCSDPRDGGVDDAAGYL